MKYNCEWLKHHINDTDPTTFPCEWAKENWHKTISQITEPFPCDNLREKWEGGGNYRTVLYTDGTFIINEKESDIANNVALHGDATNVYPALDATHLYEFDNTAERYWDTESSLIKSVEFGSEVKPTMTTWWFASMGNLTDIDWTGLDTSEVVDMGNMFYKCAKLTDLDLSSFDTSNVTSFGSMFAFCQTLTNLNLSGFNTSNSEEFGMMFSSCKNLTSLDLSGFDTSNANNMNNMFSSCNSLTELNLLNFNTSNVMYFDYMFSTCESLKTIYVKESFDMSSLESGEEMFYSCRAIVGGSGTTYQGGTYEYARIDNPPTEPGYFTVK